MNKTELIAEVAAATEETKKNTTKIVDAVFDSIIKAVAQHDKVQIIGFGTFEAKHRAARMGRNPQTGEEIEIPASYSPSFKAGKEFKTALKK